MALVLDKVVVVGVGLIGGSFALGLKQAGAVRRVVGIGRSRQSLDRALALGVIDDIGGIDSATLGNADLVLLAMPVGQMEAVMEAIAPHLGADTVVTDGGSTKRDVIAAANRHLPARLGHFVPGHPIAGAEKSGVAAADANLYRGKRVVLTPLAQNSARAVELVRAAWVACGASLGEMNPEEHDRVFAAVSHLPHLLAFALVADIAERGNAQQLFGFAAGGFRDFTRIAGSDPEMWRDIALANREVLLEELATYTAKLECLRQMLERGDGAALEETFRRARDARNAWLRHQGN
ncbi:MAG: prephenate dehydrogenase/arogenate dehydrogenase family protein [Pseudomonadota bacterium]